MSAERDVPSAVERVLTKWFLLKEEGTEPDLEELCEGDPALLASAERLLGREPDLIRRQAHSKEESSADDGSIASGTKLDDFRILREIGRGASGTVFLAEQERLGRTVALKVVDRSLLSSATGWDRLRREAAITARLNHPNIVPIYAIGEEGDRGFIAMRYLAGPALNHVEHPVDPERAARYCQMVAWALAAAHEAGVVHRDVKPANIILQDQVPYLVDFGLARSSVDPTLTSRGSVPGTLPYMAPELLSREEPSLDPRTDVYALGVTLYELLAGRLPFFSDQPVATMRRILLQDPPAIGLGQEHRDLETIVMQALDKEPRRRLQSAEAMAAELQHYLDDEPITLRPTSGIQRLIRRARRRPQLTLFAAVSVLAVIALGTVAGISRLREERALNTGIQMARDALDEGRVDQSARTLEELLEDHERSGDLAMLADRVEAEVATYRLYTILCQRPLFLEWEALDEALAELRETRALEILTPRALPLAAAAEWVLGREEQAREDLEALRRSGEAPLATASIAAFLGDDQALTPPSGSADEHVLRSLVLNLLTRPYADQKREIDRALVIDPSHSWALYARGVLLAADGRFGRATEVLEGRIDPLRVTSDARRLLVRLRIQTGRFEEARASLDSIPTDQWGAVDAFHDLELTIQANAWEEFENRLAHHRLRFPAPALIDLAEAQYLAHVKEDLDGADRVFELVISDSRDPALRDLAEASQYRMHVEYALSDLASDSSDELETLREWGRDLWERLKYPRARALVGWKLGLVMIHVGPAGQGFDRMEDAMELLPGECLLRVNYAEHCLGLARAAPELIDRGALQPGTDRYLLAEAGSALVEAIRAIEEGESHATEDELVLLARIVIELATTSSDWGLLREARPILERVPSTPELTKALSLTRATFESLYGRQDGKGLPLDHDE